MRYLIYFLSFLYTSADESGISTTVWNPRVHECPEWEGICRPTIVPQRNFDAKQDAKQIHKALQNSEFSDLIGIIARRTSEERQLIKTAYQKELDLNLISSIEKNLKDDFKHLILALMKPLASFYSNQLHRSLVMKNYEDTLEIMSTLSNEGLDAVQNVYREEQRTAIFGDLTKSIKYNEYLLKILEFLNDGKRPENADKNCFLGEDVDKLKEAERKFSTDEMKFFQLFYTRSNAQLREIYANFSEMKGHSVGQSLTRGSSLRIDSVYKYANMLYEITNNRTIFFSDRVHENIQRFRFKKSSALIRTLIGRAEIDLGDIKAVYEEKYGKSLSNAVQIRLKKPILANFTRTLLKLLEDPIYNETD